MTAEALLEYGEREQALNELFLTEEEYLKSEPERLERHEYVDGQIRAVGSASDNHEGVTGLLFFLLFQHLRGKPCRIYKGDMKLRVRRERLAGKVIFCYPDIMVVCDPVDNNADFKTKPKLIVEVLSHDKGRDLVEKLAVYREIETLEEYFVISQHPKRPEVTVFRRRNSFQPESFQQGEFSMESMELALTVSELYDF